MNFPFMLVMRNNPHGLIWQAYEVENEDEVAILTKNARHNGFVVMREDSGYTTETSPGWRDSDGWKRCLEKHQNQKDIHEHKASNEHTHRRTG